MITVPDSQLFGLKAYHEYEDWIPLIRAVFMAAGTDLRRKLKNI